MLAVLLSLALTASVPIEAGAAASCPNQEQVARSLARLRGPALPPWSELSWTREDTPEGAQLIVRSASESPPKMVVERRMPFPEGDCQTAADAVALVTVQHRRSLLPYELPRNPVEPGRLIIRVAEPTRPPRGLVTTRLLVAANSGLAFEGNLAPMVGLQLGTELRDQYALEIGTALPLATATQTLPGAASVRERVWSSSAAALRLFDGSSLRFAAGPAVVFSLDRGHGAGTADAVSGSRSRWAVGGRLELFRRPSADRWEMGVQATLAGTVWSSDFLAGSPPRRVLDAPAWVATAALQIRHAASP